MINKFKFLIKNINYKMNINHKSEKDELDIINDLFIIPIGYENNLDEPTECDNYLHFADIEANMYTNGSKIWCLELPETFFNC